jgi:hypothetical protein
VTEVYFNFGEPALTNLNDSQTFNLGVKFRSSSAVPCVGVRWRVPDTVPSGQCKVALWSGAGSRLASATVTYSVSGQTITYFAASVNLTADTDYLASILTPDRYVATTNFTWPHANSPLTAVAANGWLQFSDEFPDVQSGNGANFHVSPVLETSPPVFGTASAVLGGLTGVGVPYALGTTRSASTNSPGRAASQAAAGRIDSTKAGGRS